jgi:hypothetical protein
VLGWPKKQALPIAETCAKTKSHVLALPQKPQIFNFLHLVDRNICLQMRPCVPHEVCYFHIVEDAVTQAIERERHVIMRLQKIIEITSSAGVAHL